MSEQRIISVAFDADVKITGEVIVEEPFRCFSGVKLVNTFCGSFSYIANNTSITSSRIGRYCSIGDYTSILSNHPTKYLSTSPIFYYSGWFGEDFITKSPLLTNDGDFKLTVIGNDVWTGSGAKIKTGVTISDGCVIGAGSIVTKDTEPFMIYAGVPAKPIKQRFSDKVIEQIISSKWWEYDITKIKDIDWSNPVASIDAINNADLKKYNARKFLVKNESDGSVMGYLVN